AFERAAVAHVRRGLRGFSLCAAPQRDRAARDDARCGQSRQDRDAQPRRLRQRVSIAGRRRQTLDRASLFRRPQLCDLARLVPARRGLYWVQLTARRSKALLWMGVGRVVMVKGMSGARAVATVFRVMVARSAISVWKLW